MNKLICILVFVSILFGCSKPDTVVKNPSLSDIEGKWEGLHASNYLPYFLLNMNSEGKGVVITANEEAAGKIFDLHSFVSFERSFHIIGELVFDEDENEQESIKFEGVLDNGLLCFEPIEVKDENEEEDTESICFIRIGKIEDFRNRALEVINEPLLQNA